VPLVLVWMCTLKGFGDRNGHCSGVNRCPNITEPHLIYHFRVAASRFSAATGVRRRRSWGSQAIPDGRQSNSDNKCGGWSKKGGDPD
jgi:hypothetical protein